MTEEKDLFALTPLPGFMPGLNSWGATVGRYQFVVHQDEFNSVWGASYKDMQHADAKPQKIRNSTSGDFFPTMAEAMAAIKKTFATLPKSQRHELTRLFGDATPEYNAAHRMLCATSLEPAICDSCNSVHLLLLDPAHITFAEATLSVTQIDDMTMQLQKLKQQIIMRSKTEGLKN